MNDRQASNENVKPEMAPCAPRCCFSLLGCGSFGVLLRGTLCGWGGCGASGGFLPALKPCAEQLAEAEGPWGKGFKGLHRPQGTQSIAARGDAAAVGILPSLPALAPSPHLTLELRHPWDPKGHHHLVCKIFGVAEQCTAGGKGLSAEPSWRWQRMGRPAQALRSTLDGQADGPGGRAMSHGCREGASVETGWDGPAAATATPRSVIRTPSLGPHSARGG